MTGGRNTWLSQIVMQKHMVTSDLKAETHGEARSEGRNTWLKPEPMVKLDLKAETWLS